MMRKLLAAVAGSATAVLLTAAPATAQLVLPAPTGPHPVGREVLHLVDHDRLDPWVSSPVPRELMVSVWYPAAAARGARVPYTSAEESRLMLEWFGLPDAPALTNVRTHARDNAPPPRSGRRLPLVMLSPGFTDPLFMQTTLAEDLASRGYLVAGINHPYEAAVVTLPGDRVVRCTDCGTRLNAEQGVASRAQDMGFVLDTMLSHPRWGKLVDPRRVAAIGHSRGGAASATLMESDPRVTAGANMDGSFHPPFRADMPRPFLLLGAGVHAPQGVDPSWDAAWSRLTGWGRWLHLPQAQHRSFSDAAVLGPWLGVEVQPLPGERVVEITREYVAAFLDQHLRGRTRPLLDGPSPRFPEVAFPGIAD